MSEAERLADWLEPRAESIEQVKAAAELRRLSAELEECQAQRRAAFRRIEEQDAELEKVRKDAERWAHACKGNNKQINVCSWDKDAYEFVGYAMKKEAIDAIADAEIAAMKGTP